MLFYLYSITLLMCYIITLFILLFVNIVLQYIPNKCLVEKEEILRIFHKTERITDEVNELSHTFCDKLIAKNISEGLETDHYKTVTSKKKK